MTLVFLVPMAIAIGARLLRFPGWRFVVVATSSVTGALAFTDLLENLGVANNATVGIALCAMALLAIGGTVQAYRRTELDRQGSPRRPTKAECPTCGWMNRLDAQECHYCEEPLRRAYTSAQQSSQQAPTRRKSTRSGKRPPARAARTSSP